MRHNRKTLAIILASLMLSAALSACSGGKEAQGSEQPASDSAQPSLSPVIGGELTVGIAQDLDDTLDPHSMVSAGTREVLFNVYEGLVKPDTEGNLIPAVASEYSISETGDTFTFTLRDGVKFHNGEELEADDVKYTVERMMDPERLAKNTDCMDMIKGAKDMLEGKATEVAGVKVVDKYTVEITLEQAYAPFLANLCVPGASIYNREACDLADEKNHRR